MSDVFANHHIAAPEHAGLRVDQFLALAAAPLSRSRVKALILEGAVMRGGKPMRDPSAAVIVGDTYILNVPAPKPAEPLAQDIPLDILFEDADLILINKPAGMAMHPAPGSEDATLVNALLHHCKGELSGIGGVERPGIVHRIDKLTTGIIVAAKSEIAHVRLAELFARHDIERVYLAATRGCPRPRSGTIETRLARSTTDRKKIAVVKNPDVDIGRRAVTHYRVLEPYGEAARGTGLPAAALVACTLETGRTHQVRVHLAHINAGLIGDPVYGKARGLQLAEPQALHASVLGFDHPITGKALRFEAPLPADMQTLLAALRALPGQS
jgi:23S rRNA pseudouridine1911/1915/1917 synthase